MICPSFTVTSLDITIPAASGGEFLVKKGTKVKEGEVLVRVAEHGEIEEYDLCSALGVSSQKIRDCLMVALGSKVLPEQVIAQSKSFLGGTKIFKSPLAGKLEALTENGILKIRKMIGEEKEVRTPVAGTVLDVGEQIVLATKGEKLSAAEGWGPSGWGGFETMGEIREGIELSVLSSEQAGKILLLGGDVTSSGLIHKAEALGVMGLVVSRIPEGQETGQLAVLAIGEKDDFIGQETWKKLEKIDGKKVFINGEEKFLFIPQ